jgi:hypothetical protein
MVEHAHEFRMDAASIADAAEPVATVSSWGGPVTDRLSARYW